MREFECQKNGTQLKFQACLHTNCSIELQTNNNLLITNKFPRLSEKQQEHCVFYHHQQLLSVVFPKRL